MGKDAHRKHRKGWGDPGQHNVHSHHVTDVRLSDYANLPTSKAGRMKKSLMNPSKVNLHSYNEIEVPMTATQAWYQRDINDIDSPLRSVHDDDDDDERWEAEKFFTQKLSSVDVERCPGVDYHIDIWYMISDYICPIAVSKFASICKKTHIISHSSRFWVKLYQRYYKHVDPFPANLEPHHIYKIRGLRTRVIRSLFYLDAPLIHRVSNVRPFQNDPEYLVSSRCVATWYDKVDKHWRFNFKFSRPAQRSCSCFKSDQRAAQIMENLDDRCCVLQAVCKGFSPIPHITGQILHSVSISVGHGMQYHKLKLVFGLSYVSHSNALACGDTVTLDPVVNLSVFDWWHPSFPIRNVVKVPNERWEE